MADSTGMADLRKENVSKIVTGFATQEYIFKDLCMVSSSNSWKETYFKERASEISGAGLITGIPRLANFPYGEPEWTETSSRLIKFGVEGVVSWEDQRTNEIDVIARTLLRISRAVAKAVDDHIWDILSVSQVYTGENLVTITAGNEWDSATIANQDPIKDILNAIQLISENNYNPYKRGWLLVNPKAYRNLLANANVRNAGQFWTDSVTKNGTVGKLCGLGVKVSNSVTADNAMVVIAKECANYKQAQALTVQTIVEPGINTTIRAWEVGVCQLTNPLAVCGLSGMDA